MTLVRRNVSVGVVTRCVVRALDLVSFGIF